MKEARPCVNIFYSAKRKLFLVFSMGMRSSGQTLLDAHLEIAAHEFDLQVNKALIQALDSYQAVAPPDRVWRPTEGVASFIKKHLCIEVERLESGELQVTPLHYESGGYTGSKTERVSVTRLDSVALIIRPLHHKGGGYVGRDEDAVILQGEEVHAKLADTVRLAFKRAT